MKIIGNILWLALGGLLIFIEYIIASVILCITIIGIPFGIQTFKIAFLSLWPFGAEIKSKESDGGCLSLLMNVIWICFGGFWICLTHIVIGILLFITIIGIPFAKQHFKLAGLALVPFGKEVTYKK